MSLLAANGSSGMASVRDVGPDMLDVRSVIRTSAEAPRERTLGLRLSTAPEPRSSVALIAEIVAGTL